MPALRLFGRRFTNDSYDVDDLVQDTVVRALASRHRFMPGTSMKSWTFTILKNLYMTAYKNRKREPNLGNDLLCESVQVAPSQEWAVRQGEMIRALNKLPVQHRETLLRVAASESYDDTAAALRCEVGTVKSRVFRARQSLALSLGSLVAEDVYAACV